MKTTILIAAAIMGLTATAHARQPDIRQPDRIKYLAYELKEAAHHVRETAEEYAHNYGESHALKALHRLDRQARHFHRQVERYYQDPYHTEKDYRKFGRAYRRVRRSMQHLHTYEHVYDDFNRVEELLNEMTHYYSGRRFNRRPHRGRLGVSFRWRR